jgi:hypothetical protein
MNYLKWKLTFWLKFRHAPGHYHKTNNDVISEILHLKLDKSLQDYKYNDDIIYNATFIEI